MDFRYTIAACLTSLFVHGTEPEQILSLPVTEIRRVHPVSSDSVFLLPFAFNEANPTSAAGLRTLRSRSIRKISLCYSKFRLSENFDQHALNLQRLKKLKQLLPEAFRNSVIEWRMVAQTDSRDAADAAGLFHGFVIEYQPAPTPESAAAEAMYFEHIVGSDSLGTDSVYYVDRYRVRQRVKRTGFYFPRLTRKKTAGILYKRSGIWNRKPQTVTLIDSVLNRRTVKVFRTAPTAYAYVSRRVNDTTVMAVLNRKKEWQNMVLVSDITGSMSPYTTQLLIWYKLNHARRKVRGFIFFNDGNDMPDQQKKVGRTGGLYSIGHSHPDEVADAALKAMRRGTGGDAPENNCEALMYAQQKHPDAPALVMVADNWANMRDMELVSRLKKPVHIILCGVVAGRINTQYLELARRTGGSVHTLADDISFLMKLSEGNTISIGAVTYQVKNGVLCAMN